MLLLLLLDADDDDDGGGKDFIRTERNERANTVNLQTLTNINVAIPMAMPTPEIENINERCKIQNYDNICRAWNTIKNHFI